MPRQLFALLTRVRIEQEHRMFIPQVYTVALAMMALSMICWGSWANTQKATGTWRFELFYWDYVWGILLCAASRA